jgi:hypothetical protein
VYRVTLATDQPTARAPTGALRAQAAHDRTLRDRGPTADGVCLLRKARRRLQGTGLTGPNNRAAARGMKIAAFDSSLALPVPGLPPALAGLLLWTGRRRKWFAGFLGVSS